MTSALILAQKGYAVTIVEKSQLLGMTLRGFTKNKIYFDTGLHVTGGLANNGLLHAFLKYLAIPQLPLHQFDPAGYLTVCCAETQKNVPIPADPALFAALLKDHFPSEHHAITTFLHDVLTVCQNSSFLNFHNTPHTNNIVALAATSLANYLNGLTHNKTLTAVLSSHCLLHGVSPSNVSFAQHAYIIGSYLHGAHTILGGGKSLVNAFEQQLKKSGVTIICNDGVKRVHRTSAGAIQSIQLDSGREVNTEAIIFTPHPSLLPELFPVGTFKPSFTQRMSKLEDTPSAHILFGTINAEETPELLQSSLLLLPENALERFFNHNLTHCNGPLYITMSPTTKQQQRTGISIITSGSIKQYASWVNSSLHKRPPEYSAAKQNALEEIRNMAVLHYPNLRNLEIIDGATPLTLRDYMHTPTGSLYGAAHSLWQFPPSPATKVKDLWIAGQSVVAPGLLGAMISAFLTCGYMTNRTNLLEEVAACV